MCCRMASGVAGVDVGVGGWQEQSRRRAEHAVLVKMVENLIMIYSPA